MKKVQFNVSRGYSDEITFAEVTANVPANLENEKPFLKALTKALSIWVATTEEGRHEWVRSSKDFNIGDLSVQSLAPDTALGKLLIGEGIHNLNVETFSNDSFCDNWVYDTVLVDE